MICSMVNKFKQFNKEFIIIFFLGTYTEAKGYVNNLSVRFDFNPFGSDHVSYLNEGIPATLAIDQDWDQYPYYHRTTDLPSAINTTILTKIAQLELAAVAIFSNNK